jgi:hypothetical protein
VIAIVLFQQESTFLPNAVAITRVK